MTRGSKQGREPNQLGRHPMAGSAHEIAAPRVTP
jgi:hypothetical protein